MGNKLIILAFATIIATPGFAQLSEERTPPLFNDNPAVQILDRAITSYIRTRVALDKTLSKYPLKISTVDGIVLLSGNLQLDQEASDAIELSASTPGVKEVDASMLSIKKNKLPFNDLAITAKINGAYSREQLWGNEEVTVATIDVATKNGVVYLSGNAVDNAQKQTAIKLAESIPGVVWVSSSIKVD